MIIPANVVRTLCFYPPKRAKNNEDAHRLAAVLKELKEKARVQAERIDELVYDL